MKHFNGPVFRLEIQDYPDTPKPWKETYRLLTARSPWLHQIQAMIEAEAPTTPAGRNGVPSEIGQPDRPPQRDEVAGSNLNPFAALIEFVDRLINSEMSRLGELWNQRDEITVYARHVRRIEDELQRLVDAAISAGHDTGLSMDKVEERVLEMQQTAVCALLWQRDAPRPDPNAASRDDPNPASGYLGPIYDRFAKQIHGMRALGTAWDGKRRVRTGDTPQRADRPMQELAEQRPHTPSSEKTPTTNEPLPLPEKPDGLFESDGFRFRGIEVRFGRAARQRQLMQALWDSTKNVPAEPRNIEDVITLVYGDDLDTSDATFRQLCSDLRTRLQRANCPLEIENLQGKVTLKPL